MRSNSCMRVARQARPSSISSGGVASSPATELTTSGKNATRKVTITRDNSLAPSATSRIGASATFGTDWVSTSSG